MYEAAGLFFKEDRPGTALHRSGPVLRDGNPMGDPLYLTLFECVLLHQNQKKCKKSFFIDFSIWSAIPFYAETRPLRTSCPV